MVISKFSFSFHIQRICFQNSLSPLKIWEKLSISLSLLEKGEPFCKFLFLFSKLEKGISNFSSLLEIWDFCKNFSFSSRNLRIENPILFLFSKVENLFTNFSFSSRKWGKEFQSSLSLLQIGEKNFKFLFLFSIGLFGLSSMPVAWPWCPMFHLRRKSIKKQLGNSRKITMTQIVCH